MIVFKYRQEFIGDGRRTILRPVADVYLQSLSKKWIKFYPYIDSGADVTMIPFSLGKLLGFVLDDKIVKQIGGIRGSVPVIYLNCLMKIDNIELTSLVSWALIEEVPPLLGRHDVFDRFEIIFKQKEERVIFSP